MGEAKTALVTGGSGYFGEVLTRALLARGYAVRVFDLNAPDAGLATQVEFHRGDIRDAEAVARAASGMAVIHHNVAQVPLAKDKDKFWSVNSDGTRIILEAARKAGARKVVYTSSSAVFGVPKENPVTRATAPTPAEEYGRAKEAGERMCHEATKAGLDVTIIRPRTIVGHGRLGIFQILFDWVSRGLDVPVFDGGGNVYQFVHADDLAAACLAAGERAGPAVYNIGAAEFGTMRELLEGLIAHAGTKSRVKSLPLGLSSAAMNAASALGLSPLGPYHSLMYGRSLYFDISDAVSELGYAPRHSNASAIEDSYDWYLAHRHDLGREGRSHHQSPVKQGAMVLAPLIMRFMPS
ncbi:MAG: NAD-dependent epimerase/dehydratase family protein [Alphaproteobacteria bacterium]|nr:NAD-dependent epimerase/dehydratase family protein [Alphaproteobacteria bacterium]